jgi:NAD(P)-dependent dehydrogenase (short-subunit alcohol dehydrogenase family)
MAETHVDRAAVVTGAAGGIGLAVVSLLRARGYAVIAEDISPAVTEQGADSYVIPLQADVADSSRRSRGWSAYLARPCTR